MRQDGEIRTHSLHDPNVAGLRFPFTLLIGERTAFILRALGPVGQRPHLSPVGMAGFEPATLLYPKQAGYQTAPHPGVGWL